MTTPDAYLASYPKSGRTWLRFLLAHYLNLYLDLDIDVDFQSFFRVVPNREADPERGPAAYAFRDRTEVPFVLATHAPYDRDLFEGVPVVFLLRSIPDVLVSRFFHMTRQHGRKYSSLGTFVAGEDGVEHVIGYLNSWAPVVSSERVVVITYNGLHDSPVVEVIRVLRHLSITVDEELVARAIELSSFERMREQELKKPLPGHSYDQSDREASRVRSGVVGGFREHLDEDQIAAIARPCEQELTADSRALLASVGLWPVA